MTPKPSVETLGYFRMSLRDRAAGRPSGILVEFDIPVRSNVFIAIWLQIQAALAFGTCCGHECPHSAAPLWGASH